MKTLVMALFGLVISTAAFAQAGYQIRPGDTLTVEVVEDPSLNREVLVLPDGSVSFPFAGSLPASGRTTGELEGMISRGIAPNFAIDAPTVFVNVRAVEQQVATGYSPRTIDVYFLGELNAPGVQELPPGTTLLQALSLGGGFTNFAAQRRIQLRRTNAHTGEVSVATIDYRAISNGGVLSSDPVLADGDVILVPERRLFE